MFAFTLSAYAQVESGWERTGFMLPDYFGSSTERGLAYGEFDDEALVLVASRGGMGTGVFLHNAETGADAGTLNPEGVSGGTYAINDIGVSDDGVIFAANLTLGASGDPFKVYRWTDLEAEAEVVIDFTGTAARLGDKITVVGSASDNTLAIYAPASRSNEVYRFTTEDNGDSFSHDVITFDGFTDGGIQPSVAPVGLGDEFIYYNASPWEGEAGMNPALYNIDGTHVSTISGDWMLSNTMQYFEVGDRAFLATFDGPDGDEQRVALFDVTGGGAVYMYHTPSLGAVPNLFMSGDMEVVVDDDGETATIYALAANAGVAAFTLEFPEVYAGDFYVGAEGTAPGGSDPHFSSLEDAFAAFEDNEPTGPITLYITSDLDEDGGAVLEGAAFTESAPLTIRPLPGTTPTVSLGAVDDDTEANAAGLALINSPYVTVDGSAEAGGTSRDLTLLVTDEEVTRAVLIFGSSDNSAVRNTNIETSVSGAAMTAVRITMGGPTPMGVVVENSSLGSEETSFHIGVSFNANTGQELDSDILGNDIYASYRGITTWWMDDARLEHNRIWITGQYPVSTAAAAWPAGMYLVLTSNTTVIGNEIRGFTTNTSEGKINGGFVINANLGDVWIYNNMIAVPEFSNNGAATDNRFFGVGVTNAAGAGTQHILHNTIHVGSSTQTGTIAAFGWDAALQTTEMQWDVRNNIFVVEPDQDNAYAIHWPIPEGNVPVFDDNNLYVPNGYVGHWRGSDFESLNDWQFGAGLDGNSVSQDVEFVSELDLRLTGASVGDEDLAAPRIEMVEVDIDGNERGAETAYMGAFEAGVDVSIDRDRVAELPKAFELHQNYPNPFNPSTTISYTLRDPGHVRIQVFNVAGQLIHDLVDGYEPAGKHEVNFDAGSLASGMYLYRIEFEGRSETRQMVLVK